MQRKYSIRLKATFLLVVFSLNTVIGLACNMGINMGYNNDHHDDGNLTPVVHIHKDGKQHIHYEKAPAKKKGHHPNTSHDHKIVSHGQKHETTGLNHTVVPQIPQKEAGCCEEKVLKFDQIDKAVAKSIVLYAPLFELSFFKHTYKEALYASPATQRIKHFVRSYHPPIPDIRIAIQSFLI